MNVAIALVVFRLIAACIFAVGAVLLIYVDKEGWGWCVFASIVLGSVTYSNEKGDLKD